MAIDNWSTTAGSNATVDSINWAENQAPSTVNDSARALMADVRTWYNDYEWRDWGHTVTYASATTFTVATDVTSIYVVNQPIRCTDATTLYGKVASRSYSAPNTTVTVTLDSGSLSASLTAVSLGQKPTGKPIDVSGVRGAPTLGANTFTAAQTIQAASPYIIFIETDAAADNGHWDFAIDGEAWRLRARDDAGSSATNIIIVQRTGTTVDSITLGGPLVLSSTFSSTKAAETGYSRVTPNMCRVNVLPSETSLTRDTITLVTGPTGSGGLILRLMAASVGAGSIADRSADVFVYSDSGGTTEIARITARGHEEVASAGVVTCQVRQEVHVKTDSSSRVWLQLTDDAGNSGLGGYMIVGYYD